MAITLKFDILALLAAFVLLGAVVTGVFQQ